jgi:serine phosphatase RsbU (regulator of sigma subunit)
MSLIGHSLLNDIVVQKRIFEPERIMSELDRKFRESLGEGRNAEEEGMDIALCRIEKQEKGCKVVFCGARRPLLYVKNGLMEEQKGDRRAIGGLGLKKEFHAHEIALNSGDLLYLFSDGYGDQKADGHKLGSVGFKKMLATAAALPLDDQKAQFELFLAHSEQMDDVSLLGLRID